MGKFISGVLAVFSFCLVIVPLSRGEELDAYRAFMADFYRIDDKEFSEFSCKIALSTLDPAALATKLKPVQDRIVIDENVGTWNFTYKKAGGLMVTEPHLTVRIKDYYPSPENQRLALGVEMINQGNLDQITGITKTIKSIFDDFVPERKAKLKGFAATIENGMATVEYERDNDCTSEITSREGRKSTFTNAETGMRGEGFEEWTVLDGKLATGKSNTKMEIAGNRMDVSFSAQYQKVGPLFFPSRVDTKVASASGEMKQEITLVLTFTDCVVR